MIRLVKLWILANILPVLLRWREDPALEEATPDEPPSASLVSLSSLFLLSLNGKDRLIFEGFGFRAPVLYQQFTVWVNDPALVLLPLQFSRAMLATGFVTRDRRGDGVYFKSTEFYKAKRMVRP